VRLGLQEGSEGQFSCRTVQGTGYSRAGVDEHIYNVYIRGMDAQLLYRGQVFMWNAEKAAINASKHGVRFETACEVFFDGWKRRALRTRRGMRLLDSQRIGGYFSLFT
jgi:hypothetical protein